MPFPTKLINSLYPFTLLQVTLLLTLLHFKESTLGNSLPDPLDLIRTEDLRKRWGNQVVIQRKHPRHDERRAGVVGRESRDNDRRRAVGVHLHVEGTLREDGGLVAREHVADHPLFPSGIDGATLGDHLGDDAAGEDEEDFGGSRVDVQGGDLAACGSEKGMAVRSHKKEGSSFS